MTRIWVSYERISWKSADNILVGFALTHEGYPCDPGERDSTADAPLLNSEWRRGLLENLRQGDDVFCGYGRRAWCLAGTEVASKGL